MRQFFASLVEVIKVTFVAVGAVLLIRNFLVQPFLVSGSSMVPNFHSGDYLLIDELTYNFRAPERGEVVVFRSPLNNIYFIKRIIGLPGEEVRIINGEPKIINKENPGGFTLKEPYLPQGAITNGGSVKLGGTEYFVMGDNRSYSLDSRSWGALKFGSIVGLVRLRLWPLNVVTVFAAPQY